MTRIILAVVGVLTVAVGAEAQSPAQTIERVIAPLSATPSELIHYQLRELCFIHFLHPSLKL